MANNRNNRNGNEKITSESLDLKYIEELLECPVCLDTCQPPIHVCENGHNLCGEHRKSLDICPICRAGFNGTRNITAEKLLEKLIQSSKTRPDISVGNSGRLLKCCFSHLNGCDKSEGIPFQDYIEHLEKFHIVFAVRWGSGVVTRKNEFRGKNLIRNGPSKMFTMPFQTRKFVIQYHQEKSTVWVWIALHDTNEEQRNQFKATLSIENTKNLPKLEWSGPVKHLTIDDPKTPTTVENYGTCLKTTAQQILDRLQTDDKKQKWFLTVKIIKISKEQQGHRSNFSITGTTSLVNLERPQSLQNALLTGRTVPIRPTALAPQTIQRENRPNSIRLIPPAPQTIQRESRPNSIRPTPPAPQTIQRLTRANPNWPTSPVTQTIQRLTRANPNWPTLPATQTIQRESWPNPYWPIQPASQTTQRETGPIPSAPDFNEIELDQGNNLPGVDQTAQETEIYPRNLRLQMSQSIAVNNKEIRAKKCNVV